MSSNIKRENVSQLMFRCLQVFIFKIIFLPIENWLINLYIYGVKQQKGNVSQLMFRCKQVFIFNPSVL